MPLGNCNKMSINIHPTEVVLNFDNHVCYLKAKRLRSLFVARCIPHIATQTRRHTSEYKCYCFKCHICQMLIYVLFSRGHLRLMSITTPNNFLVSEKCIWFFRIKSNGNSWTKNWNFLWARNCSTVSRVHWRCSYW